MKKYHLIFESINEGLIEFSKYLLPRHKIREIDYNKLTDQNSCNLTEKSWKDIRFPNSENNGVYFIFGQSKNDKKIGVYIGKASFSSFIGSRLNAHLNTKEKENKVYPMEDKQGNVFLMELIVSIPMDNLHFFASALEEFLICKLQQQHKNIYLLNTIGTK